MNVRPTVVIGHPSADLYGSDRQLLETVVALCDAGARVVVSVPHDGPLCPLLTQAGAVVRDDIVPVLRKSAFRPFGFVSTVFSSVVRLPRLVCVLRREDAGVMLANTLTVPLWLVAGRLARVRVLCHVHEAEDALPRPIRILLALPLLLAHTLVVNSAATGRLLQSAIPRLATRVVLVHNGIPAPEQAPCIKAPPGPQPQLLLVGRWSPRKGTDTAVEAVRLLHDSGHFVRLDLVGSVFPGYEWFEADLRRNAEELGIAGHVRFVGFRADVWPELAAADVVLVPSRAEPFGNVAVEAQLARRPVVVTAVQGLVEIVQDGRTGLVVPPDDPAALAEAVRQLLDDWPRAEALAEAGYERATEHFSPALYRSLIAKAVFPRQ